MRGSPPVVCTPVLPQNRGEESPPASPQFNSIRDIPGGHFHLLDVHLRDTNSRRSNVVRRMGLSSSRVVVIHAHETRKSLAFATASAKRDDARGPDNTLAPPNGRARPAPSPEVAVGAISQRLSPNRQPSRFSALSWTAGTPRPGRGRKAHICCLSGGTDGVSPEGPQRSEGRA